MKQEESQREFLTRPALLPPGPADDLSPYGVRRPSVASSSKCAKPQVKGRQSPNHRCDDITP